MLQRRAQELRAQDLDQQVRLKAERTALENKLQQQEVDPPSCCTQGACNLYKRMEHSTSLKFGSRS